MAPTTQLLALLAPAASVAAACESDADCSYNGRCGGGQCACAPQWTGPACATLALLPASRTAGFHSPHNTDQADVNTSSWGGSILRDEATGIWHMYSAEMIQHCGIGAWEPDR